ncbi:c-type cytochrome [Sulfurovum sp. zt1-1]|uniref:C-type cytochrome n=1 Tax=Sulfurovum zhangzhouensis TaxID=3019067 RepID=A0ABT7R025_9BACT|nr:c-type cytochrome [Sulfurovum zhangzhouensis]MDM5272448.1 c-type cytochrome [Sulfurovum zhangzhouensis]
MFKSYHKLLLSAALVVSAATSAAVAGDKTTSRTYANGKKVIDGGATYPVVNGKTSSYYVNEKAGKGGFAFGRKPTENEIKAWNIDVMPDGTGLPEGSGSVEDGDALYEEKCASCHFDFGAGGAGYPALAKGNAYEGVKSLKNQRTSAAVDAPNRVFGSYWPKASTLWWYVKTGMPHPAPMSLTNDEVYAIVAYIISINELTIDGEELDDEYVLDREKFLKLKMPNEDGFEPKIDGKDGLENVRAYFNDFSNYGNGTRCMKNCFDGEPVIARIQGAGISAYSPELSTERSMPAKKEGEAEMPGKKEYEASCAVCHATDAMGAPMVGDKKAWEAVTSKGMDKVYHNALNGLNAMPPRGGTSLPDDKIKEIVDYMVSQGK